MPSAILNKKGFTLIEIMVAISILSIMLAITFFSGKSFNDSVSLRNASKNVDSKIRLAKSRSIGALNDTNYGIHFDSANGRAVVFSGSSFTEGAPGNEVLTLPVSIEIYDISLSGGGNDIVFGRLTGETGNSGSIGLRVKSDTSNNEHIYINSDGQTSFSLFQTSTGPTIANGRHVHFDLGWNIQNATQLKLVWVDASENPILPTPTPVNTAGYFNADKTKFDWEGSNIVNGKSQNLRIHSWLDASSHTVLCVMRDQTEEKKLNIYFVEGGIDKRVAYYVGNAGIVTVAPDSIYGGTMEIQ